jgi:hypothetical protein
LILAFSSSIALRLLGNEVRLRPQFAQRNRLGKIKKDAAPEQQYRNKANACYGLHPEPCRAGSQPSGYDQNPLPRLPTGVGIRDLV